MNRRERRVTAKKANMGQEISKGAATALYEAGFQHFRAGERLQAQIHCEQALAIEPQHAESLHLMGLLSLQTKQLDHAVEWFSRAIRQNPRTDYLCSLGVALKQQGRLDDALQVFDKAVQLKPDDAELWKHLGGALVALNRFTDALLAYRQALQLNPRHWEAAFQSGTLLHRLERFEEALACFDLCDELRPDHVPTLLARARLLRGLGRFAHCLAENERAHALDPNDPVICGNIADALLLLGRFEDALPWLDRSLALRPDFVATLSDKAVALAELRRFDEALAVYHRARALDPGHAVTTFNLALLQMLTGDLEAGWQGREARGRIPAFSDHFPKFSQPIWIGADPVGGKTILVWSDEGFGDSIQFARYIPMLAARGAKVILMIENSLCSLLSELAGVSQSIPKSTVRLPDFDFHCPLSSLPLAFGTTLATIPAETRYLRPLAADRVAEWEKRLGARDRLRVGLVWSGNPKHHNDRNRSIPLRALARILDVDATFVSLQKNWRPEDKAVLAERSDIIDLTADLTDFAETAVLISCLDLVISVDTSVAHLSGALGCQTWILLPYTPDYRWLLDREDSPWYPTVRLFRQTATRDYANVLDRVRTELSVLIST
jgi:tetratricopeptide (TPR) repeat protein